MEAFPHERILQSVSFTHC